MTSPAPYPARAEDVTADNLARSLAVSAQRRHLTLMDQPNASVAEFTAFVQQWGVIYLLRELQERSGPTVADTVARDLWEQWNDGSGLGEWLWEWLTEYGIDPAAITKPARPQPSPLSCTCPLGPEDAHFSDCPMWVAPAGDV